MTEYQKTIINYARSRGGEITKRQAVELIGGRYYCNESKHVGDVLGRMVKAKHLRRIKPGLFELGIGTPENPTPKDQDQIDLF